MNIVIATHSTMSQGILDVVQRIQTINRVSILTAYVDSDDFEQEFNALMNEIEDEKVIVLTDLAGGSVNQIVMRYQGDKKLEIIAGINLALVLNVLHIDENADVREQIREYVEHAREQITYINHLPLG